MRGTRAAKTCRDGHLGSAGVFVNTEGAQGSQPTEFVCLGSRLGSAPQAMSLKLHLNS